MGVGAGLYMYNVVVTKFTFAISSPDEFLLEGGGATYYDVSSMSASIDLHADCISRTANEYPIM